MKKQLLLLIPALGVSYCTSAQKLSPDILATAGGSDQAAGIILDWTLGENSVETVSAPGTILTQGFHQSELQVIPVKGGFALDGYKVAPNPTESRLSVYMPPDRKEGNRLVLTDMNGKALLTRAVGIQQVTEEITVAPYAEGLYFLHVQTSAGAPIQTFKIIKTR